MAKVKKKSKKHICDEVKSIDKKKFPTKRALILLGALIASMAVYYTFVALEMPQILSVYSVTSAILFVVYFALNRGVMSVPKENELSDSMTKAEKEEFILSVKNRREKSRPVLYIFLAMVITVLCDLTYLFIVLDLGLKI